MSGAIFYSDGMSRHAWKISIYIYEKGLKPLVKQVNFRLGQTKSSEYLQVNPRGEVPAWQDGLSFFFLFFSKMQTKTKTKVTSRSLNLALL